MDSSHQQAFFELITQTQADPAIKNCDGDTPLDIIELPLAEVFERGKSSCNLFSPFSNQ